MTPQWFLKSSIICSILQLIGKCGEASVETKHYGEVKYVERSNYSTNEERAHKKVNDDIKDFIRKRNSRHIYRRSDLEGIKKFFNKYMKIGVPKRKSFNHDDNKDFYTLRQLNSYILDEYNGYPKNIQQNHLSPTIASGVFKVATFSVEKSQVCYSQEKIQQSTMESLSYKRFNKDQILHSNEAKLVKGMFLINNSSYYKNFGNVSENISKQNNIDNTSYYKSLMGLNDIFDKRKNNLNYIKKIDNNLLEKDIAISHESINHMKDVNEKIKSINKKLKYERNNRLNNTANVQINSNLKEFHSGALKLSLIKDLLDFKKKSKNNQNDKINEKEFLKDIQQPTIELRRVRSCELKMEDLRESFLPYEQLSIYHPKKIMTDQFILSDLMF